MSRPQKMHAPLPFSFGQVLVAVAAGNGVETTIAKPTKPKTGKGKPAKKKK